MAEEITGRIAISACMMVKDEESNLPRCLSSIQDLVEEIIVVDTGSTDRTVDIAGSYGAKIYHHAWEGSRFRRTRNVPPENLPEYALNSYKRPETVAG